MSTILINGKRVQPMVLFVLDNPPNTEPEINPLPTAGAMDPDVEKEPLD